MNEILNECHNDLVNHETFYPLGKTLTLIIVLKLKLKCIVMFM